MEWRNVIHESQQKQKLNAIWIYRFYGDNRNVLIREEFCGLFWVLGMQYESKNNRMIDS